LKKGTFYYVIAVHTKKNTNPGDVFLFNVGYRRGEMALEECGDNFWEVHQKILILIFSVLSAILLTSLTFVAVMKRGKCCDIFIKPNQQKQHLEGYQFNETNVDGRIDGALAQPFLDQV